MGKKRKHSETSQAVILPKKVDVAPKRLARTLLGWKDTNQVDGAVEDNVDSAIFRNKEKIFETPKDQRKAKPFHDHIFVFSIVVDHIWFQNYQISIPHNESDKLPRGCLDKMTLIEVGLRFCLNLIKIIGGSFGGPTLYENLFYSSPNQIQALEKEKKAGKFAKKVKANTRRKMHEMANPLELDEFANMWKE